MSRAEALEPLPVDRAVAHAWATLRLALRDEGKRMALNDSWIAATAMANRIPVVSKDDDYDEVPGLDVIRV
jgi:predicted nucleic acid-binding protein